MQHPERRAEKSPRKPQNINGYTRYSGIGIQMGVIIVLAVIGGKKADGWAGTEKPIFTAIFALLGTVLAIYLAIKELIK